MSIAERLDEYIRNNESDVFIEAEAQTGRLGRFINEYNNRYRASIDYNTDGIRWLGDDVDKWGLELRLYLHTNPSFINTTSNRSGYRREYSYRINDKDIIWELFDLGYRIGLNY